MPMESPHSDPLMQPIESPDDSNSDDSPIHLRHDPPKFTRWQVIGGTISTIVALTSMVAMSEALQLVETSYSKPFLLRWIITSGYIFAIFEYYVARAINSRHVQTVSRLRDHSLSDIHTGAIDNYTSVNNNEQDNDDNEVTTVTDDNDNDNDNDNVNLNDSISCSIDINNSVGIDVQSKLESKTLEHRSRFEHEYDPLTVFQKCKMFFIPAIVLNINDIFGGYIWYLSLETTSVSVNNTIYQSQAAFTYIGSAICLAAPVLCQKNFGILLSFAGVVLVTFSHQSSSHHGGASNSANDNPNTFGGIILSLISAAMYGGYEVGIKYYGNKLFNKNKVIEDSLLLFFMIGVTSLLCYWPFLVVFNYTGWEIFELPHDMKSWMSVLIPLVLDLIMQSSLFIGITLLNSEILAFGQLFIIPLSFTVDLLWHGYSITINAVIGSILIVISFIIMEGPQFECKLFAFFDRLCKKSGNIKNDESDTSSTSISRNGDQKSANGSNGSQGSRNKSKKERSRNKNNNGGKGKLIDKLGGKKKQPQRQNNESETQTFIS